jgi:uncharacterized protein (DUF433 family)
MIDWKNCPNVECIPGKVSGASLVVDTRIPADAVLDNAEDGYSPEEIVAEIYPSLPLERAKRILAYRDRLADECRRLARLTPEEDTTAADFARLAGRKEGWR